MNEVTARLHNRRGHAVLRCRRADTLWERFRGLMLAPPLPPGQALWFPACSAVHTAFVRVPIDLLFLQGGRIARICAAVPPWRIVACPGADAVLELAAGEAGRLGLSVGQCLQIGSGHAPEGRLA